MPGATTVGGKRRIDARRVLLLAVAAVWVAVCGERLFALRHAPLDYGEFYMEQDRRYAWLIGLQAAAAFAVAAIAYVRAVEYGPKRAQQAAACAAVLLYAAIWLVPDLMAFNPPDSGQP